MLPLILENIGYEANGKMLLNDINLAIQPGLKTVILGANGAGKSLLLRLCHGLIGPTRGTARWNVADRRLIRRSQAMVFQRPVMLRRTVAGNVAYPLKVAGVERAERDARVATVLARTGLGGRERFPAHLLSGGEQQRLALARAWVLEPKILFLDEPTSNLDPAATAAVEEIVREMEADGCKIVLTTHDLAQARRLADEIVFLHLGRIVEQTTPEQFFTAPASIPARAYLEGKLMWESDS